MLSHMPDAKLCLEFGGAWAPVPAYVINILNLCAAAQGQGLASACIMHNTKSGLTGACQRLPS